MSKKQDTTKVTRITAGDAGDATTKVAKKPSKSASTSKKRTNVEKTRRSYGLLGKFGGYFKGAWVELRQVHWPTRSATWGLTGAVLLFSAFFVVFITLLDAGFKYVFEQILR